MSNAGSAAMTVPRPRGAMDLLEAAFAPLAGRVLLDVGCGRGALCAALRKRGARPTGIDPSLAAITEAREKVPDVSFEVSDGADMPFADGRFEGVVFLNSLHHMQPEAMAPALEEAARVGGAGRRIVVIEPIAEGSLFEAMRRIEDETLVRAQAAAALAEVAARRLRILRDETFDRLEHYAGLDDFFARIVFTEPARGATIAAQREAIAADVTRHALPDAEGFVLRQPMRGVTAEIR